MSPRCNKRWRPTCCRKLESLRDVSQAEAPSLNDLPPSLVTRFVGQREQHLLKVYGRGDIWDAEALGDVR